MNIHIVLHFFYFEKWCFTSSKMFIVWKIFQGSFNTKYILYFIIFNIWLHAMACGTLVPWPGIRHLLHALEGRLLITGPPGKSSFCISWSRIWCIQKIYQLCYLGFLYLFFVHMPWHGLLPIIHLCLFLQASLSSTISQRLLKFMSIESVIPSNHLILCCPLLLPSIFPRIRVFSSESALHIR